VYIRCCGNGLLWFRSYSESPFPNAEKVTQKALPRRTALRLGSVFPRYGVHPGASPPVCFAAPPLDGCGFAAWRCAPNPRMKTSARPAEGAEDQKPNQEPEPKQSQSRSKDHSLRQFLHGMGGCFQLEIGRLAGRLREQARSHSWNGWLQLEIGRLSGRHRQQADSCNSESVHPMRRSRPTQHNER
jgi:hypothetical protein